MPISDTCIYFIIAILGLAYPISLTVVTRLDEKYKSIIIVRLFQRSWEFRLFRALLVAALFCVAAQIYWVINYKPKDNPNIIFHDWADISLFVITILLVASFFFFIRKIFEFYMPLSLVAMLRKRKDDEERLVFRALTALLYAGIDISDDSLVTTISRHFSGLFRQVRTAGGNEPVKYPAEYYDTVYETIFRGARSEFRKIQHIGYSAASGRWLIGEMEYTNIDELTYAWLWNNLKLMVTLERDDYIEAFWKNSHQVFTTGLAFIPVRTARDGTFDVINQEEVDQRERERDRFFEFHTALGGMLLYEKRYKLLKRLFNHTTSIPFRYELLPLTMNNVLGLFFRFWTSDGLFFIGKYGFPDADGIQGEYLSKEYIARYTALLFIRQYHLTSQLYGYEPVSSPQVPDSQDERTTWIRNLPYFKKLVADIQQDKELMDVLGFAAITVEQARERHKPAPEALLDDLINRTQLAYNRTEVEQRAEAEKTAAFRERSAAIINGRIIAYANVLNQTPVTEDFNVSPIKGGYMLYKKAAFANAQGTTYLNYDTFFAEGIASKITQQLTALFRNKAVQAYLFRANELFEAIDRLHLKPDVHVLLNFAIMIDEVRLKYSIDRLTPDNYKGIPIITVQYVNQEVMRSSFIAMRKADLPSFHFAAPEQAEIARFHLQRVSADIELYAAVADINQEQALRALFPEEPAAVLNTSVVLALELNLDVRWKNNSKLVRMGLYSDFYQQGTVNDLSEVKKF